MNAQECREGLTDVVKFIELKYIPDTDHHMASLKYAISCVQAIGQSGEELPEYLPTNYEEDDINAGYNNCLATITPIYAKRLLEIEELKAILEEFIEKMPQETADADWWPDSLRHLIDKANTALHGGKEGK